MVDTTGEQRLPQLKSAPLTARKCDILNEISRSASNKEVARTLLIGNSNARRGQRPP